MNMGTEINTATRGINMKTSLVISVLFVLAVWSYAKDSPFAEALRDVFSEVSVEPITFKHKFLNNEEHTDWLFFAHGNV